MIEQYSQEWFNARLGKITSSTIWNLIVEPKTKKEGELSSTTKDYLMSKLAERLSGVQRDYKSDATTHGLELEGEALNYYAELTGNVVGEAGFIEMIKGLYGGTPDGFVNDDGIIQVKCPWNYVNHINYGLVDDVDYFKKKYREYYWQCQSDMLVSDRAFCDFVSYCKDMPDGLKMFILRIPANLEDMQLLVDRLDASAKFITNTHDLLLSKWRK
jgi:exodeoxyribonuclease (lambda-induced)